MSSCQSVAQICDSVVLVSDALFGVSKDGKPYIAYMCAGIAQDDARAKGYTIVAQSKFHSLEDMKFYEDSCPAHEQLKVTAKGLGPLEPPLTVYFDGAPAIDLTKA